VNAGGEKIRQQHDATRARGDALAAAIENGGRRQLEERGQDNFVTAFAQLLRYVTQIVVGLVVAATVRDQ
jgi:hypothetical protein